MNEQKVQQYLNRINFKGALDQTVEVLSQLHKCHVMTIPFENIDIQNDQPISLNPERLFEKIIIRNRGGFCYELNHLFYLLLLELGFKVSMISSRIYNKQGILGPEFDHMSLIVQLESHWILDVGYGDLFISPLTLRRKILIQDGFKKFKISKIDRANYLLSSSEEGETFRKIYQFNLVPRAIEDFHDQCSYKQYHPESYFVKNYICTLPIEQGRKTLINNIYSESINNEKMRQDVDDDDQRKLLLATKFNLHSL